MPYLRHVADLVVSELHHVDVVRSRLFAGRVTRTPGTGMSTRKDSIGSDVVSFGIGTRRYNPRRVHPYRICSDAARPRCIKRGQCRTRCDIRYEVEKAQRIVNYEHGVKDG